MPIHADRSRQAAPNSNAFPRAGKSMARGAAPRLHVQDRLGSCACGGGCPRCKGAPQIQTKLTLGAPDDKYEREADQIADRIVAMDPVHEGSNANTPSAMPVAQHISSGNQGASAGQTKLVQRKDEDSEEFLQAKFNGQSEPGVASDDVLDLGIGSGQALSPAERAFYEPRFGRSFGRVRLHTDSAAQASARSIHARAFTYGGNIVFGNGEYRPDTLQGRRLLAHELTHVIQQGQSGVSGRETAPTQGSTVSQTGRPVVQRSGGSTESPACAGWTCVGDRDTCDDPDPGTKSDKDSKSWTLALMIDIEAPSPDDVSATEGNWGHSYLVLSESNGQRYSYGFYPRESSVSLLVKDEDGCVVHPDTTHRPCVDMEVQYNLTEKQFDEGLAMADQFCRAGPKYNLADKNCTTFLSIVAKAAGQTMPKYRGEVAGKMDADNPNTIFEQFISESELSGWRKRIDGQYEGAFVSGGDSYTFSKFELDVAELMGVSGEYTYKGREGNSVTGKIDGHVVFITDPKSKAVTATVRFTWNESGNSGKGLWTYDEDKKEIRGTWGRGSSRSNGGTWYAKYGKPTPKSSKRKDPPVEHCFDGGTPVRLADGTALPIDAIRTGMSILGIDRERRELGSCDVIKTHAGTTSPVLEVVFADASSIRVTETHPILVNGAWVKAGVLEPGDVVAKLSADQSGTNPIEVESVGSIEQSVPVFNLTVSGDHTYFAGDILVHNKLP